MEFFTADNKYKTPIVADNLKRRGRKRVKDERYFQLARKRIETIKTRLKTAKEDGLTVK